MKSFKVLAHATRGLAALGAALLLAGLATPPASAAASWLDQTPSDHARPTWNHRGATVPRAPSTPDAATTGSAFRHPSSPEDREVTKAGWSLIGPYQRFDSLSVVRVCTEFDAAGQPDNQQAFVFVHGRFVGTLVPAPTASRSDGSLAQIVLEDATHLRAEYIRYAAADPMCCPSRTSTASFSLGGKSGLVLDRVDTVPNK